MHEPQIPHANVPFWWAQSPPSHTFSKACLSGALKRILAIIRKQTGKWCRVPFGPHKVGLHSISAKPGRKRTQGHPRADRNDGAEDATAFYGRSGLRWPAVAHLASTLRWIAAVAACQVKVKQGTARIHRGTKIFEAIDALSQEWVQQGAFRQVRLTHVRWQFLILRKNIHFAGSMPLKTKPTLPWKKRKKVLAEKN